MYRAEWTHRAVGDLRAKVKTKPVRKYLVEVSRTSLHRHFPVWGGSTPDRLYWRRGVTEQDEVLLDEAEVDGEDRDNSQEHGRDFVLVYCQLNPLELPRRFEITGILTNGELGASLG